MDLAYVLFVKRNLKTTTISFSLLKFGKDSLLTLAFHITNMFSLRTVYNGGDLKRLTGESFHLFFFGKFGSGEITTSFIIALGISTRLLKILSYATLYIPQMTFATRSLDTRGLKFNSYTLWDFLMGLHNSTNVVVVFGLPSRRN